MHRTVGFGLCLLLALSGAAALLGPATAGSLTSAPAAATAGAPISADVGQARTLLPDGRWLLTGGNGPGGPQATVAIEDARTRAVTIVGVLATARAWHTATLLPDRSVLVFGGIGADREVLGAAELFDLDTLSTHALSVDLAPRAQHTVTVLTDGSLLVAGGLSDIGDPVATLALWDFRTRISQTLPAQLETPRYGHRATLLANGVVALWGGFDHDGIVLGNAEFFDPDSLRVTADGVFVPPVDLGAPEVAASVPADDATNVPVETLVALRFSKPIRVDSANAATVELDDPAGPVSVKMVPAETGMLLFVVPRGALRSGVPYVLTANGIVDETGLPLPPPTLRFTTAGTAGGASDSGPTRVSPGAEAPASASTEPVGKHGEQLPEAWGPTADWRTGWPDSPWRSLPALQAPRGVTALAGQVLRLNGEPLTGVSLRIGKHTARTDESGRFLLTDLPPGHAALMIDGGTTHGMFEVGVELVRGKTTVLPYTIWLPEIDLANAVTIPSPTTAEVVITSPKIPGLEVHIPPNTVIRDYRGQVVKRLSITGIPLDRPPFPLVEPEKVPLYFTVQPGCSYVWNAKGEGARLIYPNPRQEPAGTRFAFWNYDPDDRGWYVYGHGSVIPGGAEVVPDPGVSVYEFTGAMVIPPGQGAGSGAGGCGGGCCDPGDGDGSGGCGGGGGGDGSYGGEPVHLATGLFVQRNTDLFLPDSIPIKLIRTYRQNDGRVRAFGLATTHPYDVFLEGDSYNFGGTYTYLDLLLPDGGRLHYDRISSGVDYANAVYEHVSTPTIFYKSHVSWVAGHWELTRTDGTVYEFPDSFSATGFQQAAVVGIRDRFGHRLALTRGGVCQAGPTPGATCTSTADCGSGGTCFTTGNLLRITSPHGRRIAFTYGLSTCPSCVTQITDNVGRTVQYGYDCSNRLVQVVDAQCGLTTYSYENTTDRIVAIRDANQNATCHPPSGPPCAALPTTCGPAPAACSATPTLALTYYHNDATNGDGTVQTQTLADGASTYTFSYQMANRCEFGTNAGNSCSTNPDCNGSVRAGGICFATSTKTALKDPRNYYRVVQFNPTGYSTSDAQGATDTVGSNAVRTVTYGRQSGSNLLNALTEPLTSSCRRTTFGYDPSGNGNVVTLTRQSGPCPTGPYNTTLAQTTFTYQTNFTQLGVNATCGGGPCREITLNQLASLKVIDPSSGTPLTATTFNYPAGDPLVRLTSITDGSGLTFPVMINGEGQLVSISDATPQHNATTFAYQGGDVVTVTDATNNSTRRFVDAAGRVRSVTDALGRVTQYGYDNLNHLMQVTDPLNGSIALHYDWNGNLDKVTDNRHTPTAAVTQYHYNALNQLDWRKDPLLRQETFGYDGLGNLLTYTDRRGVITDFTYDALNRRRCAGFGRTAGTGDCQSTGNYETAIQYGYDTGSRLTQATDSVTGLITRGYDDLDNVTSETTPQGSISYFYDAASRRQTMTVVGQPTVGYCFDGASRLTKIIQGTNCTTAPLVGITYDGAGRRGTVSLPNADAVTYNYDNASRPSSLQYSVAGTPYGLGYSYDAAGNRIQLNSDWARTGLPAAMSTATYDLADELKTWNGTALPTGAFDANGNLQSDGTNSYSWNKRNQLTGITGGITATFTYDAFGRRTSKTVGGVTTNFLYDGLNPVQELVAGTVTANLLTGLGIDEVFRRSTISGGTTTGRSFSPDALGSTVALTDDSGSLQTQYRYEPFGRESLVSGSPSDSTGNPYQFTGRENDGTGLYYYRARYYAPTWGRFISEDPLLLVGISFSGGRRFGLTPRRLVAGDPRSALRYNSPTRRRLVVGEPRSALESPNLYSYVDNMPLRFRDPTGQQLTDILIEVGEWLAEAFHGEKGGGQEWDTNPESPNFYCPACTCEEDGSIGLPPGWNEK